MFRPVVVLLLVAAAVAVLDAAAAALVSPGGYEHVLVDYHETWGVREAARISQAERAIDFDGNRIIGDHGDAMGSHIHFAGVIVNLPDGRLSVCGASLLTHRHSVTAAQCWLVGGQPAHSLTIVFGSRYLFRGGVRLTTSNVTTHANYNPNTLHNNVAIINHEFVSYTSTVRSIPLPAADVEDSFVNVWAVVAGYGADGDNKPITQDQVGKIANMQIMSNQECAAIFGPTIVTSSTLCAHGQNNASICAGDFGGPLVVSHGDNRQLVGIASFISARGCELGLPSGFTRVTSFQAWIRARIHAD